MKKLILAALAVLSISACSPVAAANFKESAQENRQDNRQDQRFDNRRGHGHHPTYSHVRYAGPGIRFPLLHLVQFTKFYAQGVPYYIHPINNNIYVIDNGTYYPVADPRGSKTTIIINN